MSKLQFLILGLLFLIGGGVTATVLSTSQNPRQIEIDPTVAPHASISPSPSSSPISSLKPTIKPTTKPVSKKSCPFFYYAEFSVSNNVTSPAISLGTTAPTEKQTFDLYAVKQGGAKALVTKVVFQPGEKNWSKEVTVPSDATKLELNGCSGIQQADLSR
jgi:hypothetical protein